MAIDEVDVDVLLRRDVEHRIAPMGTSYWLYDKMRSQRAEEEDPEEAAG